MFITTLKNPTHIPTDACTGGVPQLKCDFFNLSVRAGALEGLILVLKEGERDERFVAAAVSFGPGVLFMSSEEQRALGYENFFESLSESTKTWWNETYGPLSTKLLEEAIGLKGALDAWVPVLIATIPEYQQKGYGTALVKHICRVAADDKTCVSLASTEDVTSVFYKDLGFKVEGRVDIPSPFGEFTCTLMSWKNPK
ncbi:hypothetical protein BDQ17DRAFT_1411096 [Cyathus striatus]|nr:hypothetical protein BDQ17DRAFT_1411096 [Cyathus striatus]